MPTCATCEAYVSHDYYRVFSDNRETLTTCPNCKHRNADAEDDASNDATEGEVRLRELLGGSDDAGRSPASDDSDDRTGASDGRVGTSDDRVGAVVEEREGPSRAGETREDESEADEERSIFGALLPRLPGRSTAE